MGRKRWLIAFSISSLVLSTLALFFPKTSRAQITNPGPSPTLFPVIRGLSGRIVYSAVVGREDRVQVYTMNADGTEIKQITNTVGNAENPNFSLDGTKIVFSNRYAPGTSIDIFLVNSDGTGLRQLTHGEGQNDNPVFSPDGQRIVFESNRDNPNNPFKTEIYIMNADGSGITRLTNTQKSFGSKYPTYSPDGVKIIFSSDRDTLLPDIYTINTDGSRLTRLTSDPDSSDSQPTYLPDGSKIVFVSTRGHKPLLYFDLYTMNPDGSNQILLSSVPIEKTSPALSPDGSKIIFTGHSLGISSRLYVFDRVTNQVWLLPNSGGFSTSGITWIASASSPPPSGPIQGDLNHDGKIDIFDYNIMITNFGQTNCGNEADIDSNCKVDIFDYNILVANFGK